MDYLYQSRSDAGRCLASALEAWQDRPDVVVLGIARGGVPVAAEVSRALHCPLDVVVVRKLGVPTQPELAMGAVACGGIVVRNEDIVQLCAVSDEAWDAAVARETRELARREHLYRGTLAALSLEGREVLIVDDGLATGATLRAAVASVRRAGARRIVAAVPLGSAEALQTVRSDVDELICLEVPEPFFAVACGYAEFGQVQDEEVSRCLEARREQCPIPQEKMVGPPGLEPGTGRL